MKQLFTIPLVAIGLTTFAQNATKDPATVLITPQQTLSKNDTAFRREIAKWSDDILKSRDYKNIKAQPSSVNFPGSVKPGYKFVSHEVTINHQK